MAKYNIAIFDLDGTIADSKRGIINAFSTALAHFNLSDSEENLLRVVGPPLSYAFEKLYNFKGENIQEGIDIFRTYYREKGVYEVDVFPGIPELLEKLKNTSVQLAIATSKPEIFAKKILSRFSLDQYFELIVGASLDLSFQEKEDILKFVLKELKYNCKDKAVMIGDRYADILAAKKCNIDSLGVLYGYGSHEELITNGATMLAEKPIDIYTKII